MTLEYADSNLPTAKRRSRASRWIGIGLILLFVVPAVLTFKAIRWDQWANYESNDTRWWKNLPGESYASYKAWFAWRKSWERASVAALCSGACLAMACGSIAVSRITGKSSSRWLLAAIVLHCVIVTYFAFRWGPDFRQPYPRWTG